MIFRQWPMRVLCNSDNLKTGAGLTNERALAKVQDLYNGHGRGMQVSATKDTAWGLLCAMTEYVDHERRARSNEYRLDKRTTPEGVKSEYCPSPNSCPIGANGQCKPYGRLNVRIGEDDEVGSFIFRTTGFNSIRTLASRLHYFSALSGKKLSTLPLELKLRSKSTTMSFRTPIYYVDLVIREGMTLNQAINEAHKTYEERIQAGFKQEALDEAARNGFAAGAFEENEEDGVAIVEEFYPEKTAISVREGSQSAITLAEKIAEKAANT